MSLQQSWFESIWLLRGRDKAKAIMTFPMTCQVHTPQKKAMLLQHNSEKAKESSTSETNKYNILLIY